MQLEISENVKVRIEYLYMSDPPLGGTVGLLGETLIYKVKRECRGFSMCAGLGLPSRLVVMFSSRVTR